ncbi:cobalamin B12-binding domain-containing protein [Desulfotomaculum copahuensis]|uniref:Cobalamin-binding protein n=1 Tax=Desulfotomaculum copahuensis TaxID=1838280 RepID=A0A1B7LGL9_9FIRM|nr:cobalamin-dependent protein [Desulfotomaculum copahuensis]OAT85234.1 cobalamin-binding protein [Desulfotomaculum copahuensis]
MTARKILLVPLDPVHDVGLKMIRRGLAEAGHETMLLPPDLSVEEVVQEVMRTAPDTVLISRTLGYGVAEVLARLVDLLDAVGVRDRIRLGVGGMAVRPELAAELGFDGGFGPGTTVAEALAFVEDREYRQVQGDSRKEKQDFTAGYSYEYRHRGIREKLAAITDMILTWAENKTSPGVERAAVREELWDVDRWRNYEPVNDFFNAYAGLCGETARNFYEKGIFPPKTRRFTRKEVAALEDYVSRTAERMMAPRLQRGRPKPLVFNQYGTGCPFMDIGHIKVSEGWGADGVIHFDPSWGARTEGLFDGFLTHEEDGTLITPANLNRIKKSLEPGTLWQVRAHRGLNTPETAVLAGKIGADLTKINICYGALGAGTEPARMTVDGIWTIRYAAKYNLPFDVVTNEELCGVPAYKAFAGMLITVDLALRLGGRPVLQPLFCYSPEVMIGGQMEDNYVDFNAAKVVALKQIIDAPVWPGAPVGFLTQTEDRVQSSAATAFHACAAAMLGADAVTIASSDEAYSGGPISVPAKIDTLQAVKAGFRFFGRLELTPTRQAELWSEEIIAGIEDTLARVVEKGDFVQALYDGVLGSREDGAYPGRNGRGTVIEK